MAMLFSEDQYPPIDPDSFDLPDGSTPVLTVSKTAVALTGPQGGPFATDMVFLGNTGGSVCSWTAADDVAWAQVDSALGELPSCTAGVDLDYYLECAGFTGYLADLNGLSIALYLETDIPDTYVYYRCFMGSTALPFMYYASLYQEIEFDRWCVYVHAYSLTADAYQREQFGTQEDLISSDPSLQTYAETSWRGNSGVAGSVDIKVATSKIVVSTTAAASALSPGIYTGTLAITSDGGNIDVGITLTVSGTTTSTTSAPTSPSFTGSTTTSASGSTTSQAPTSAAPSSSSSSSSSSCPDTPSTTCPDTPSTTCPDTPSTTSCADCGCDCECDCECECECDSEPGSSTCPDTPSTTCPDSPTSTCPDCGCDLACECDCDGDCPCEADCAGCDPE